MICIVLSCPLSDLTGNRLPLVLILSGMSWAESTVFGKGQDMGGQLYYPAPEMETMAHSDFKSLPLHF